MEELFGFISIIERDSITKERDEWKNDEVWTLIRKLQQDTNTSDTFTCKNDSLWYKDPLYLCNNSQIEQNIRLEFHASSLRGHSGFLKNYHQDNK